MKDKLIAITTLGFIFSLFFYYKVVSPVDSTLTSKKIDESDPVVNFVNQIEEQEKMEWDGSVTVEMIVESMSLEFPEFVMALAEENFIRGYEQAIQDTLEGYKLAEEAAQADAEE